MVPRAGRGGDEEASGECVAVLVERECRELIRDVGTPVPTPDARQAGFAAPGTTAARQTASVSTATPRPGTKSGAATPPQDARSSPSVGLDLPRPEPKATRRTAVAARRRDHKGGGDHEHQHTELVENELLPAVIDEPPGAAHPVRHQRPRSRCERMSEVASALVDVIKDRKLFARISGHEHITAEGWTTLGGMLGIVPVVCLDEAERDRRRLPRPRRGPHAGRPRRRRRRVGVLARGAQVEDRRAIRDPQHGPDARDRPGAAGTARPDRRVGGLRALGGRGDAGARRATRARPRGTERERDPIPDPTNRPTSRSPSSSGCSPAQSGTPGHRLAGARPRRSPACRGTC